VSRRNERGERYATDWAYGKQKGFETISIGRESAARAAYLNTLIKRAQYKKKRWGKSDDEAP
jgi:hypothetical protein